MQLVTLEKQGSEGVAGATTGVIVSLVPSGWG